MRVLVLGGAGFIGRHVVAELAARGATPIVGSRHPERRRRVAAAVEHRAARLERLLQPADWTGLLAGCEAVVNCVGILRERGQATWDRVHHQAPAALAAACAPRGVRLVHVSALGLDAAVHDRFLTSKRDGEAALRACDGEVHIVRPALLDGEGGYGARWLRRVARWPLHPLPSAARGRLAVLDVRDLAEAIATLALDGADAREHDLGGPHLRTLGEHLAALRSLADLPPARTITVPNALAAIAARACDALHWTPFSRGHWELLQRDNRPRHNALPALLGRAPRPVGAVVAATPPASHRPLQELPG